MGFFESLLNDLRHLVKRHASHIDLYLIPLTREFLISFERRLVAMLNLQVTLSPRFRRQSPS